MQTDKIKISKIRPNTGQIDGLPQNPRLLKDDRFHKLVKSIQDDPEMLDLRELIVVPKDGIYVVIAGNMRLRAMQELKMKEAPCKVLPADTAIEKLRAYTIKDNVPFGEHDWSALANEWDAVELVEWGLDLPKDPLLPDEDKEDYMPGFRLVVECTSEAQQQQYFKEITNLGIECKPLTL